jgi:hypothetical protein
MDVFTLLIAIVALVVGGVAFARTGGMKMLHEQMEDARSQTAKALDRLEGAIRPNGDDTDEPAERKHTEHNRGSKLGGTK